jgi:hypothetical protein
VAGGTLYVQDRGGTGHPFTLDHGGAKLSWVLNGPGELSCLIPAAEARKWGASGDNWLGAKWVRYALPGVPDWGGVVTSVRWAPGTLELICQQFHVLFRRRRVPRDAGRQTATAGALARAAYNLVQADDYCFIADFQADEEGEPVAYEWKAGDLMDDVFRELVTASGQEWGVDADRVAQWRIRLGSDKSATVQLNHPHEIVDYTLDCDLWTVENDIEGIAADDKFADAAYAQVDDDPSIKLRGRYMTSRRYPNVVSKGTVAAKVLRDLREYRDPVKALKVTTTQADHPHLWSLYGLGDSVLVVLPDAGVRGVARIEARSVDVDAGMETLGMVLL